MTGGVINELLRDKQLEFDMKVIYVQHTIYRPKFDPLRPIPIDDVTGADVDAATAHEQQAAAEYERRMLEIKRDGIIDALRRARVMLRLRAASAVMFCALATWVTGRGGLGFATVWTIWTMIEARKVRRLRRELAELTAPPARLLR